MSTMRDYLAISSILLACIASGQSIPAPTETVALAAEPPYSSTGELFILQADTNAIALHNPVLVVEGFDINNSMGWEALYTLLDQENLAEDIQAYGRDLLVLNFDDSTIDILANAALTKSAISYINAHRADPDDKFTAVGASLGGVTIRKALVDMVNHDVDTWISFDAPHEGANLPLGLQEFFEYFSTVAVSDFDSIRDFLATLDRPATRQLLITHHSHVPDAPTGGSTPERQDFISSMNAIGYPSNCKTIAISNGSGFGEKQLFYPGDTIIHWNYDGGGFLSPNIDADIHALPFSTNTASTVFYGRFDVIFFGQPAKTVNSYSPLMLDNAPGGYRGTFYELFTNLPPSYIDGDDYCSATNHCFVPTVSALGIPIENIESNLAINADITTLSPFDEIHYAVDNEAHVEINSRNKRWFVRALLEDIDTDGDGYDDYQEYLMGTEYDSADSTLEILPIITPQPSTDSVQLSWNSVPNTQYEVWYADALANPWELVETIPSSTSATIVRTYPIDTGSRSAFFLVVAYPVDPVSN